MVFAALGDIHGNLPALRAVLSAIDSEGIQTLVHTGDAVVGSVWPREVIAALVDHGATLIRGEWDRRVANAERKRASLRRRYTEEERRWLEWTYETMSANNIEFLRGLPKQKSFTVDGVSISVCHGTHSADSQSLGKNDSGDRFRRQREVAGTDIVVCGRSHEAYSRWVDGTLFLNPGAVGVSTAEEGTAAFAVVCAEEEPWTVELRSISYDIEEVRLGREKFGLPLLSWR